MGRTPGYHLRIGCRPRSLLLNSAAVQKYTDGQLKWIIDNGIFPVRDAGFERHSER